MRKAHVFITYTLVIFLTAIAFLHGATVGEASTDKEVFRHEFDDREVFIHRVSEIWGNDSVWEPSPTSWVQYESDLGERSAIDFKTGVVRVQLLLTPREDAFGEAVLAHLRQGVRNLVLGDAEDPIEMVILAEQKKKLVKNVRYSKKQIPPHDLSLGYERKSSGRNSIIINQLRRQDGSKVLYKDVSVFAEEVVNIRTVRKKIITGGDGIKRQAVTVQFNLAPNHLEIRARAFYPIVAISAAKYNIDPALIMGIIHTESMFNPRARSRTPAFGLMQLVPEAGAREAYTKLFGKKITPSSRYLYNPRNNIELGVAYFNILQSRYMKLISDPASRTYCAIAAYNAGASNVGSAFISHKSIKKAIPSINALEADDVYHRLVNTFHIEETRLYTQKVLIRSVAYVGWK